MTTPALPDSVMIAVEAGGRPLAGAWVVLRLGTTRKNPHGMLVGPMNGDGEVVLLRDTIEENVDHELEMTPMDYVGLKGWDGSITVEAMNRDRVRRAISAIDTWKDLGSLKTEENLKSLRQYRESLETIAGMDLSVRASCEPRDAARVEAIGAQA
jgi:hypothetical protein